MKVWATDADSLSLVAECKGHKRGVWCVAFSPVDKVLGVLSALRYWGVLCGYGGVLCPLRGTGEYSAGTGEYSPLGTTQVLLSASADSTIRLWSLDDYRC